MGAPCSCRLLSAPHLLLVFSLLFAAGCADAPSAPPGELPFQVRLLSKVSLVAPQGASGALNQAFDLVDRFRLVIRRVSDGQVVADVTIAVTPGQDSYTLSAGVPVNTQGELFEVTVTALVGDVVLFQSPAVRVAARLPGTPGGGEPLQVNLPLNYTGPGAVASSVAVNPRVVVLGLGGTVSLTVQVLDSNGAPIANVPLAWESALPSVASVTGSGVVSGVGEGVAALTVSIPTGLSASAWVYVLSGEIAFVRNGHVFVGPVAGTQATNFTPAASGAQTPSWDAGGQRLFYVQGGVVHLAGRGSLGMDGSWPSLSPDGLTLAVERGGRVFFANDDGTFPTPGPAGSTPVWAPDGQDLYVGGGSIERIAADGSRRSTVAAGSGDQLPAVSPSGRLAFIGTGGVLVVADASGGGRTTLPADGPSAASRPTWSPGENFLVFTGSDGRLYVVAADGRAPAAPLPLGMGQDPAWRGGGAQASPRPLSLQRLEPNRPAPGQEADIVGSGFDVLIPRNNRAYFPGDTGPIEAEVVRVASGFLRVRVPPRVRTGTVRVTTRTGQATLPFDPGAGALRVTARTTEGDPLPGVDLQVRRGTQTVAHGTTDNQGAASFEGLPPEDHTLVISSPQGFQLQGAATRSVRPVVGESITEELVFRPQVARILIDPEQIVVEVGRTVSLTARPEDVRGRPITRFQSTVWASGSTRLLVEGNQLTGTATGVFPSGAQGDAGVRLGLDHVFYSFPATVTSFIEGTVSYQSTTAGAEPVPGPPVSQPARTDAGVRAPAAEVTVELWAGETLLRSVTTDASGGYRFGGLLAGTYTVTVPPMHDYHPLPKSHTMELGPDLPSGRGDFVLSRRVVAGVEVAPDSVTLRSIGDTLQLTATARTAWGEPLTGLPTLWVSTHPGVAAVSSAGLVTAVANGTTKVIASVDGVADTAVVVVQQEARTVVIQVPVAELVFVEGDSAKVISAQAFDAKGNPVVNPLVVWSSSDPTVVKVHGPHATSMYSWASLVPVGAGTATIEARAGGAADSLAVRVMGHCDGPVTIVHPADLEAFYHSGCGWILGDLHIEASSLAHLGGLDYLIRVGGSVFIRNNPHLVHIGALARLRSVGGDFYLVGNPLLSDPPLLEGGAAWSEAVGPERSAGISLPPALTEGPPSSGLSLVRVGGDFVISASPLISHLNWLSKLQEVGRAMAIAGMHGLASADGVTALRQVGGLYLADNPTLRSPHGFPGLKEVGEQGLNVFHLGGVTLGFPTLERVAGPMIVTGHPPDTLALEADSLALEELVFPTLRSIGGGLVVFSNPSLRSLLLPALEEIGGPGGEGVADSSPGLATAPRQTSVGSSGEVLGRNPAFEAYGERQAERAWEREGRIRALLEKRGEFLRRSGIVAGSRAPTVPPPPPALGPLPSPFDTGEYEYEEDPAGFRLVYNPALTSLSLTNLRRILGDFLLAVSALESLSLPKLRWVGGGVFVEHNEVLESFSFPVLEGHLGGSLYIGSNSSLATWTLPLLEGSGNLRIFDNPALAQIPSMPALTSSGQIEVSGNTSLSSLSGFSALQRAHGLALRGNALTALNGLESLQRVSGFLEIRQENHLVSAHLPALEMVGSLEVFRNPILAHISAPSLQVVGGPLPENPGTLAIEKNDHLAGFSFPLLHTIMGDLHIAENHALPNLDGFDPSVLRGDLVHLYISDNPSLASLAGLYGLGSHDMNDVVIHGNLFITFNPSLGDATAWAFVAHLNQRAPPLDSGGVAGIIVIYGNGGTQ